MNLDSLFFRSISGVQIVGQQYSISFGAENERRCLSRVEMRMRGFGTDRDPFAGKLHLGNIGLTAFEFAKNGPGNEYLTGQLE